MKHYSFLCLVFCVLFFASCSDTEEPSFSFGNKVGESVSIEAEAGAETTLSFESALSWQASVSADWLSVAPESGEAGKNEITLTVDKVNNTGEPRSATLRLTSGSLVQEFEVVQDEYIRVEKEVYQLSARGGDFVINFVTTLSSDEFNAYTGAGEQWIVQQETNATRVAGEETSYYLPLRALPNEGNQSRTMTFYFVKEPFDNATIDNNILATVEVVQAGLMSGESTDYSRDGEMRVIQTHSAGNGIPLVLMGDGFIDKEIANGYYDQVMEQAVENIFTEHPISELRDYFDIYSVTVVSPNSQFGVGEDNEGGESALGCWMELGMSTLVGGNDVTVQQYLQHVEGIDLDDMQVVVILNSSAYKGTNYNYFYNNGTPSNFSIAYFPVIENLESENFRRVLVHETVGHGIGKLEDEYAYQEQGAIPMDQKLQIQQQQRDFGWWRNVDFTADWDAVLWSDFLQDSRYDGQGLGVFEGACTYATGAYRPTEESMMNGNTQGFNAPSRRAIYDNVMQRGEGRTPSLEEFIAFDLQTYQPSVLTKAAAPSRPFARPRVKHLGY